MTVSRTPERIYIVIEDSLPNSRACEKSDVTLDRHRRFCQSITNLIAMADTESESGGILTTEIEDSVRKARRRLEERTKDSVAVWSAHNHARTIDALNELQESLGKHNSDVQSLVNSAKLSLPVLHPTWESDGSE